MDYVGVHFMIIATPISHDKCNIFMMIYGKFIVFHGNKNLKSKVVKLHFCWVTPH